MVGDHGPFASGVRYEFRVWGRQRRARRRLARMGEVVRDHVVTDCYLLGDDADWNVKVRKNTLKLKRRLGDRRGFERWVSERYRSPRDVPDPFEAVFTELDRARRDRSGRSLRAAASALGSVQGRGVVPVRKHRRRYRVGGSVAEATDIVMIDSGETYSTLAIEGGDLEELTELRKALGLQRQPNVALHEMIAAELDAD